jgi:hypothetical protein
MISKIKSVKSINPFQSVIQTIYDSVTKGTWGTIEVESVEGEGTTFNLKLQ